MRQTAAQRDIYRVSVLQGVDRGLAGTDWDRVPLEKREATRLYAIVSTDCFRPDGSVLRTSTDTMTFASNFFRAPAWAVAYLPGPRLLFEHQARRVSTPLDARAPVVLVNGLDRDSVLSRAVWRGSFRIDELGGPMLAFPLRGDFALLPIDPRGRGFAIIHRGALGTARPAVRVSVWWNGVWILRECALPYLRSRPSTTGDYEEAVAEASVTLRRVFEQLPGVAARSDLSPEELVRANLPFPDHIPPVDAARLSADEKIWLRLRGGGEEPSTWLVLTLRAEALGLVELPAGFEFQDHAGGRAWGFEQDSLDVPYVVGLDVAWERADARQGDASSGSAECVPGS